ncbi:MAG: L-rhamnose isomerase, partial [Bacteroidales bacterium]|nr:L-rhamnose isomerase [Bacteroidales bacterium]
MKESAIKTAYEAAKERYAVLGVDADAALEKLQKISISIQCWQADDVTGFENLGGGAGGGIQATGNYPGRARNIDELRKDIEKVLTLVGGKHRLSLHAIYGDFEGKTIDRNAIEPEHFSSWMNWAKEKGLKLDFNSTSFGHPKSGDLTLA